MNGEKSMKLKAGSLKILMIFMVFSQATKGKGEHKLLMPEMESRHHYRSYGQKKKKS